MSSKKIEPAKKEAAEPSREIAPWNGPAELPAITSQEQYLEAVGGREAAKDFVDSVDEFFEPMHRKALDAYQEVQKKFKETKAPALAYLKSVNARLGEWHEAEEQRLRLAQNSAAADGAGEVEELREGLRRELRRAGYDDDSVEAAVDAADLRPSEKRATAMVQAEKLPLSTKVTWTAEVVELLKLVKFVASREGRRFAHLLLANETELNKLARAQREKLDIPGVRPKKTTGVADRPRR